MPAESPYEPRSIRPAFIATSGSLSTVLFAAFLLLAVSAGRSGPAAEIPHARRVVLSKEEMLAGAEALRSRIEDLTVSYSNRIDEAASPGGRTTSMVRWRNRTVATKGGKTFVDNTSSVGRGDDERIHRRQAAYNGRQTTIYTVNFGRAMILEERSREASTRGDLYFILMLLGEPRQNSEGYGSESLITILRDEHARVRENLEEVDGHPCHVVDLMDARTGQPQATVWIDCERGFLPLRHAYYRGEDRKPAIEHVIEKAAEVEKGLWFAVRGRRRIAGIPGSGVIEDDIELVIEVDGHEKDAPAIKVNSGIKDEFFDLWKRLPPGTKLANMKAGVRWTVGGEDLKSLGEGIESPLEGKKLPIPEPNALLPIRPPEATSGKGPSRYGAVTEDGESGTDDAGSAGRWRTVAVGIGAVLMLAIVCIWLWTRRRRREAR